MAKINIFTDIDGIDKMVCGLDFPGFLFSDNEGLLEKKVREEEGCKNLVEVDDAIWKVENRVSDAGVNYVYCSLGNGLARDYKSYQERVFRRMGLNN